MNKTKKKLIGILLILSMITFGGLFYLIAQRGVWGFFIVLAYLIYTPDPAKEAAKQEALNAPCMKEPYLEMMLYGDKITVPRKLVDTVFLDRKKYKRGVLSPHEECIDKNKAITGLSFKERHLKNMLVDSSKEQRKYPFYPRVLSIWPSYNRKPVSNPVKEYPYWKDLNENFSYIEGRKHPFLRTEARVFIRSKKYTFPNGNPFIWVCPIIFNLKEMTGNCLAEYNLKNMNYRITYYFSIRDGEKERVKARYYIPMKEWVTVDKAVRKYVATLFEEK